MGTIEVTFRLEGWHAQHFRRVMEIANLAPGPRFDPSSLAASILRAVLEDDARDHDIPTSLVQ
jgi:hypothetical protein